MGAYTSTVSSPSNPVAAEPLAEFVAAAAHALAAHPQTRVVLAKPVPDEDELQRVDIRALTLRDRAHWSFVYTHRTRDVTKNVLAADAARVLHELLETRFQHAHLQAPGERELQLLSSRKGRRTLLRGKPALARAAAEPPAAHDRIKHRHVEIDRPFLVELGVTDAQHRLVPAMARKWKQINKFVEVLDHAIADSPLAQRAADEPVRVLDFGSGKGYLTFAMHEHLQRTQGRRAQVTGVELREDMVALCNDASARLGLDGLRFERGDVGEHAADGVDIMVALHACDTATDHAIHKGVRAGAAIIMCSPCCHKELRPQLLSPHPLRPILKHGVHLGQQAEMLTDGLRAMLLDACGYDTQVFEFISLEHTNKNKMILAVRRAAPPGDADARWREVREVKDFYGIRDQCLERLLRADREAAEAQA